MDDFELFTVGDRQDLSYGMCIAGTTLAGGAIGRFAGLYGLLAGAIAGAAYGLATCRRLAPAIEHKLFSSNARLTESEALEVMNVLREQGGVKSKADAMYVTAAVRYAIASQRLDPRSRPRACLPLAMAASQIVATRA